MERQRPKTMDRSAVRDESLSGRDSYQCVIGFSVDAWPAVVRTTGLSPREEGGVKTPGRDPVKPGAFLISEVVRDQLQVIRRSLWILSARLEVLPAKIELAYRRRRELTSGDRPDRLGHSSKVSGDERPATQGPAGGGWRARWRLARLRSRADQGRAACGRRDRRRLGLRRDGSRSRAASRHRPHGGRRGLPESRTYSQSADMRLRR
jgi:hypothetical protein